MINVLAKYLYHFLIGVMLFFLVWFIWRVDFGFPSSYTDLSFHMATAQAFLRAGGITTWDFWESLPLGRPHNYPPLFHLIMASLLKIGFSPSATIKLMMELTVVGGFAVYSWGLTKLFNIKIAFWSVLLLVLSTRFLQLSSTVMPATIVTFLVPALLYFVLNKKWLSYSALLVIMFYLHLYMPYFILLAMLIYILLFKKNLLKHFLITSIISFTLFIPWLAHIIMGGWEYIKYLNPNTLPDMWRNFILINILAFALLGVGVFMLFKKRKTVPNQYFFFLILAIIILSPSFFAAARLIDSHFIVCAVVISSLAVSEIWQSRARNYLALPLLVYFWLTPTITLGKLNGIVWTPSTINHNNEIYNRIYYDPMEKFSQIIKAINKNAKSGETITTVATSFDDNFVDRNYRLSISNIFTPYTNLSTLNLRQPEIYQRPLSDLKKSKFLLSSVPIGEMDATFFSDLGYLNGSEVAQFVKDNFQFLSSSPSGFESNLYCMMNTSTTTHENIPLHKFPLYLGDGLLIALIGVTAYGNKKVNKNA